MNNLDLIFDEYLSKWSYTGNSLYAYHSLLEASESWGPQAYAVIDYW